MMNRAPTILMPFFLLFVIVSIPPKFLFSPLSIVFIYISIVLVLSVVLSDFWIYLQLYLQDGLGVGGDSAVV